MREWPWFDFSANTSVLVSGGLFLSCPEQSWCLLGESALLPVVYIFCQALAWNHFFRRIWNCISMFLYLIYFHSSIYWSHYQSELILMLYVALHTEDLYKTLGSHLWLWKSTTVSPFPPTLPFLLKCYIFLLYIWLFLFFSCVWYLTTLEKNGSTDDFFFSFCHILPWGINISGRSPGSVL